MTIVEELAINQLTEFLENAKSYGLCYNGRDMPEQVQIAVTDIVEQYVGEYLAEDGE